GLFTEILTNGGVAFRRTITFVEEEVERLVHAIEPLTEFITSRRGECNAMLHQAASGALDSFLDGLFSGEEGVGDFAVAETAQCFQGQSQLILARKMRMAAREHHSQLAVVDLRIEKKLVNPFVMNGARAGPRLQYAFTDLVA